MESLLMENAINSRLEIFMNLTDDFFDRIGQGDPYVKTELL